jgi:hypothetical protein
MKMGIILLVFSELIIGFGVWGLIHATQDHDQVVVVGHLLTESEYTHMLMWYAFDIIAGLFICGVGAWRLLIRR